MLNPLNVKDFMDMVGEGNQADDIMTRFGFPTLDSIACFITYMQNTNEFSSTNQPEGTLIQRAIQHSFDDVEAGLPMQLASR